MNNPEHDIEGPEPETCEDCMGEGKKYFSPCCGHSMLKTATVCPDPECFASCVPDPEDCETCKGAGSIPYDEESARDDHYERKMESLRGND